jgi:hypothetical protein
MSCILVTVADSKPASENVNTSLAGTLVSSLHRLKDVDNTEGGFFVFGDLSVKLEGDYRLQFTLYEVNGPSVFHLKSIISEPFSVHASKNFPGMSESTSLTRSFSDQGVRLRLRKEPRKLLRKRGPASDDYQPRHYNIQNRRQSHIDPSRPMQPQTPDNYEIRSFATSDRQRPESMQQHPQIRPQPGPEAFYTSARADDQPGPSDHSLAHVDEPSAKRTRIGSGSSQQSPYPYQSAPPLQIPPSQYGSRGYPDATPSQSYGYTPPQTHQQSQQPPPTQQQMYSYGQTAQQDDQRQVFYDARQRREATGSYGSTQEQRIPAYSQRFNPAYPQTVGQSPLGQQQTGAGQRQGMYGGVVPQGYYGGMPSQQGQDQGQGQVMGGASFPAGTQGPQGVNQPKEEGNTGRGGMNWQ